jgi:hypothetical protein
MVGRRGLARPTRVAVRRGVLFGGIEENEMETTARTSPMRRRCVAIGLAAILATAALLPSAVSADRRAPAAPVSLPVPALDARADHAAKNHPPGDVGDRCSPASDHAEGLPECTLPQIPTIEHPEVVASGHSGTSASGLVEGSKAIANGAGVSSGEGSAPAEPAAPVTVAGPAPNTSTSTSTGAGASGSSAVRSSTAERRPGGPGGAPVAVLPAPSQPTVLGPVPLVVPAIGGVASPAGGALPWTWFVALAVLDVGLLVGSLIRRRRGRGDGPRVR